MLFFRLSWLWHLAMRKKTHHSTQVALWFVQLYILLICLNLFFSLCLSFKPTQLKQPPIKIALYYHPPPTKPKKPEQVTSFCNSNSKPTPCLLLFLLFFLLLLLTRTNKPKPAKPRQNCEPRCIIQGLRGFGTIGRQSRTVRGPRPNAWDVLLRRICLLPFWTERETPWRDKKHEQTKIGPTKKKTCFRWWAAF